MNYAEGRCRFAFSVLSFYKLPNTFCHFSDEVLNNSSERSEESREHLGEYIPVCYRDSSPPPFGRLNDKGGQEVYCYQNKYASI